jgi:hypothetical protein
LGRAAQEVQDPSELMTFSGIHGFEVALVNIHFDQISQTKAKIECGAV